MTELWNSVDYLRYAEEQFHRLLEIDKKYEEECRKQGDDIELYYLEERISLAIDLARLKKEMHWDGMR
jgi:hypothetical protein